MAMDLWQRRLLILVVPATTIMVVPSAMDPVGLPKLVAGASIAVGLASLTALRVLSRGRAPILPVGPPRWSAILFVSTATIATAVAGFQSTAVMGQYGRYSGLVLYVSAAVIFLHLIALGDARLLRGIVSGILVAGGVVAGIGILQGLGLTVLGLRSLTSPLVGTLGNPNFFSASLGIITPLAIARVVDGRETTQMRAGAAALGLAAVGAAAWSRSFQGILAAGVGVAVLFLYLLWMREEPRARVARWGLAAVTVVGAATVAMGIAGTGPLSAVVGSRAVQFRLWYWEAALKMFQDHPMIGLGMDQYSGSFRRYRSSEAFREAGVGDAVDAAHSVPLSMFASGGLLLGAAYLAVIVVVAWAAAVGLRRADARTRPLLGAFVGGWFAYQVQSLLSIDVPGLTHLHWVLAGSIIALAAPWRTAAAVPDVAKPRSAKKVKRSPRRSRAETFGSAAVVGVAGLALLALGRLFFADLSAGSATDAAADGRASEAVEKLERAIELAPRQSTYHATLGELRVQQGHTDLGLDAFLDALAAEPDDFPYTITAARLSAATDQADQAAILYQRAIELEPNSPEIATEAAEFFLVALDDAERARGLVEHALAVSPGYEPATELAERIAKGS